MFNNPEATQCCKCGVHILAGAGRLIVWNKAWGYECDRGEACELQAFTRKVFRAVKIGGKA